ALASACRSVLPMVDPRTGHVHVANEQRRPFPGAETEGRIGETRWALGGELAADSLAYVGRVDIPAVAVRVDVTLRQADLGEVANTYGALLLHAARTSPGS